MKRGKREEGKGEEGKCYEERQREERKNEVMGHLGRSGGLLGPFLGDLVAS